MVLAIGISLVVVMPGELIRGPYPVLAVLATLMMVVSSQAQAK